MVRRVLSHRSIQTTIGFYGGLGTDFAGTAWAIDPLPLFIGNSRPQGGLEQRLDGAS
jgi:hypothetical protein